MHIADRFKTDTKFRVIVLIIATLLVPYITIPVFILWWFYRKSKFSNRFKIITTTAIGSVFFIPLVLGSIAYAQDVEPHLSVTEPAQNTTIQAHQITITGDYAPADRDVQINGSKIKSSKGTFSYTYQLKVGKNSIDVSAGRWKWSHIYLNVTREMTDAEKAAVVKSSVSAQPSQSSTASPTPAISTPSHTTTASLTPSVNQPSVGAIIPIGSSQCTSINGLPDPNCTPGVTDPNVTQANIDQTICVSGYTATVRPPVSYTDNLKVEQIKQYGYTDTNTKDYEEDHFIPLEVGGSPSDPKNLWPEPGGSPNAKDTVENLCHKEVCDGQIGLSEAQREIATNWHTACGSSGSVQGAQQNIIAPPPVVGQPPAVVNPPTQTDNTATVTPGNGATALCNDGIYSYAAHHQGACSHNGGVSVFYK